MNLGFSPIFISCVSLLAHNYIQLFLLVFSTIITQNKSFYIEEILTLKLYYGNYLFQSC